MVYAIILFFLWNVFGAGMLGATAGFGKTLGLNRLSIVYQYRMHRVNWFGAFCLALGANLICPIASLCYWFVRLCTVGRK
jgi:hypothetical protein